MPLASLSARLIDYFREKQGFLTTEEFYFAWIPPYFIPPERSVDIDRPLDLDWAEFLLKRNGSPKGK